MKLNFGLEKEKTVKNQMMLIILGSLAYLILTAIAGRPSDVGRTHIFMGLALPDIAFKGVITQFQLMILIYMVLVLDRTGYILSMVLNTLSIFMAVSHSVQTNTIAALPGIVTYLGAFLILTLLYIYEKNLDTFIKENEEQRETVLLSEQKLMRMAYFDALTGLPNRTHFTESLVRDISLSKRRADLMCLLFIDLDSFKNINDSLGHNAGDEVLVTVAQRLKSILRTEDVLSRFGGDEFLIKAGSFHRVQDVTTVAEKVLGVFKEPVTVQDMNFYITPSIGVAVFPFDGEDGETLIKNADMAMYASKNNGKNRYTLCSQEMRDDSIRRMKMTNELYTALERKELSVEYQPQLDTETQTVVGFEALLRWHNRNYGFVSPGEFIPLAEQTGLIKPIGLWVLKEVCLQYLRWEKLYGSGFRLSFNLSLEQLKDSKIIPQIKSVLRDTGVPAEVLEIEITESAAFCDAFNVLEKLTELRAIGFPIAIDDFGKEYSSLNRVRMFPIDRIKIDMDFIHGISSGDSKDRAIVKTIIQLTGNLGVKVIAEGVENEEQFRFIQDHGCDEVQGYLFYKSMVPEEAGRLLQRSDRNESKAEVFCSDQEMETL